MYGYGERFMDDKLIAWRNREFQINLGFDFPYYGFRFNYTQVILIRTLLSLLSKSICSIIHIYIHVHVSIFYIDTMCSVCILVDL